MARNAGHRRRSSTSERPPTTSSSSASTSSEFGSASGSRGAQHERPALAEAPVRQRERDVLVVGVEEQQERLVEDPLALLVRRGDLLAVEEHADRPLAGLPVALGHAVPVGAEPPDVGQPEPLLVGARAGTGGGGTPGARAAARSASCTNSCSSAFSSSRLQSNQEISLSWHQALLLPCWVRPNSSPPSSIGVPWREDQRGEEVALLAVAQRVDLRVVGLALDAAVPRAVVVGPVAVVLEVGLVVLVVVGDEVAQREAVVRGDEVDRRERVAAVVLVEVARAGQARGELADRRLRRARSRASGRGRCRSTPTTGPGSCRPGSRPGRRPTARRSA